VTENSTLTTQIDTIKSSISYTLGANLENLILTGTAIINGMGNELKNTLIGNAAANTLTGGLSRSQTPVWKCLLPSETWKRSIN
jgi:hypothetical protein